MAGRRWTKEEDAVMLRQYQTVGNSILVERLNRTRPAIHMRARMLGIKKPVLSVNHNFFDSWSEKMAWLLGFFAADGCVKCNRKAHVVSFKQKERYIIERIKSLLGSGHSVVEQHDDHDTRHELSYTSQHTYSRLCELFGCDVQAKSMTLLFPEVPTEYGRHFIRGCIDGDGSLFWHNTGVPYVKFVSGSEAFARGLWNCVQNSTGVVGNLRKEKIWVVEYPGIKAKAFSSWLYNDAQISLDRKRRLAKEFYEWIPKHYWKKSVTDKMREMFPWLTSKRHSEEFSFA